MRQSPPGVLFTDQFSVFEDDGVTKIPGLSVGDFSVLVWADALPQVTPITIAEIAGSPGEYKLSFTPNSEGFWKIEVRVASNDEILSVDIEVRIPDADVISEELGEIKDGGTGLFSPSEDSLHAHSVDLSRILGLLHYNAILDNQTFDSNSQLTGARLRVFDAPSHVPAVPGGSETLGLLHQYDIYAEYAGLGAPTLYRLRMVL